MALSRRKHALIAGTSLIIMALLAGFSVGYVQSSLIVDGNPQETLTNLEQSQYLFYSGVLAWELILITDLLVSYSLYKFFDVVNNKISIFTGILRLAYSIILAYAIYHFVPACRLLYIGDQDVIKIMYLFDSFEKIWSRGLIIFGFHLIGLGYLSLKSVTVPKILGYLLCFAGLSYTIIHGAKYMFPHAIEKIANIELILSAPMAISEIGLAIWLLWKGGISNNQKKSKS